MTARYSVAVTELSASDPRFRDDRGDADPDVSAALAGYAAGTRTEHEALTALAAARLLVPVVAVLTDPADRPAAEPGEKNSEMAIPSLVGADGRRALPAFTSLAAMRRWRPAARPVPVAAASVWQAAVQQGEAVIIDVGGPVPLAVEGARLNALAASEPVPALHADPDVRAAVAEVASAQPPGVRIRLGPPPPDADLTIELAPADPAGEPVRASARDAIVAGVAARLGNRSRRGIAVVVHAPATGRAD